MALTDVLKWTVSFSADQQNQYAYRHNFFAGKVPWWGLLWPVAKRIFEAIWLEVVFAHSEKFSTRDLPLFSAVWHFPSSLTMLCKFYDPPQTFVDSENETKLFFPSPCTLKHPNALHCSVFAEENGCLSTGSVGCSRHKELGFRLLRMRAHHHIGGQAALRRVK